MFLKCMFLSFNRKPHQCTERMQGIKFKRKIKEIILVKSNIQKRRLCMSCMHLLHHYLFTFPPTDRLKRNEILEVTGK